MYLGKSIAVVVPAHNEEKLISRVIDTMPEIVDHIVIVNDKSQDLTAKVVEGYVQKPGSRVVLINHEINQGVGGAIASGYKWARDRDIDIAVVMAGDAQMDPNDLPALLEPVAKGEVDYSKGNRLITGQAFKQIPKIRYFGNSALSLLTKIASGYWHVADSQTGYTAINAAALKAIDWDKMYKRYGQPNDLLVALNIQNFRVRDVPIKPVYNIGEVSGIKVRKVIFSISWLLVKLFFRRLRDKYIIRDFHPLVFFYAFGFGLAALCIPLSVRLFYIWGVTGEIPQINFLCVMFASTMSAMFLMFAMWFDMETNKHLR
jgi:glycosyltransferase involved in cell wall biosynthesis